MKRILLTIAIPLSVGTLAGYFSYSSAKQIPEVEMKRSVREESGAAEVWSADDFLKASMERAAKARQKGHTGLTDQLADWSTEEIRAALEESVKSPDALFQMTLGARVEDALLAEWMRRDFDGAIGWFEALGSDYVKQRMLPALSQHWPKERGQEAIDFALRYRGLHGWNSPGRFFSTGVSKAAEGGPAAVNEVLRRLRENGVEMSEVRELEFPAGFDFRTFIGGKEFAHLKENRRGFAFAEAWSFQDPEGACRWLKEEGGGIPALISLAAWEDDGSAAPRLRWLGGELSNWSEKEQDEFFRQGALRQLFRDPDAQITMAEGAKDPAMAERIRKMGIQAMDEGAVGPGLRVLVSIPDPARRIELLMEVEPKTDSGNQMAERLYPQNEITLRAKLREWNATEAQTETILERFGKK